MTHLLCPVLALALAATSTPALACGGFFCNRERPVDQSGERIVFAIDPVEGKVETHVQVSYVGDASEFAWVIPVPGVPEPFVSTQELFDALELATRPVFQLRTRVDGTCAPPPRDTSWIDTYNVDSDWADSASSADTADSGGPAPQVVVVDQRQVGPYESVTLQATSETALVTWLQEHEYAVPDDLGPMLVPYLDAGSAFFALRLQKDRGTGDLAPIGLRYDGTRPVIPLQLTAVAATDDMRLVPFVLGSARAVPLNYLHVTIDEAAVDWYAAGSNYEDLITKAADEAGGQAFATDHVGSTRSLWGDLYWPGRYDLARLRGSASIYTFFDELFRQGFRSTGPLLQVLRDHVPPPPGVSETAFYNCVRCYRQWADGLDFQPGPLVDDLDELIVEPAMHADALLRAHPMVTRLTSSMSPSEMTADPLFDLNLDLPEVSRIREATSAWQCREDLLREDVGRRLELSDGRVLLLPPESWFRDEGISYVEYLTANGLYDEVALEITRMAVSGPPQPVVDRRGPSRQEIAEHNHRVSLLLTELNGAMPYGGDGLGGTAGEAPGGCGCASGGGPAWLGLLPVGLVARRRRRQG